MVFGLQVLFVLTMHFWFMQVLCNTQAALLTAKFFVKYAGA